VKGEGMGEASLKRISPSSSLAPNLKLALKFRVFGSERPLS